MSSRRLAAAAKAGEHAAPLVLFFLFIFRELLFRLVQAGGKRFYPSLVGIALLVIIGEAVLLYRRLPPCPRRLLRGAACEGNGNNLRFQFLTPGYHLLRHGLPRGRANA